MKKILSIILAILMIVTTVPFAFAAEECTEHSFTWVANPYTDGTLGTCSACSEKAVVINLSNWQDLYINSQGYRLGNDKTVPFDGLYVLSGSTGGTITFSSGTYDAVFHNLTVENSSWDKSLGLNSTTLNAVAYGVNRFVGYNHAGLSGGHSTLNLTVAENSSVYFDAEYEDSDYFSVNPETTLNIVSGTPSADMSGEDWYYSALTVSNGTPKSHEYTVETDTENDSCKRSCCSYIFNLTHFGDATCSVSDTCLSCGKTYYDNTVHELWNQGVCACGKVCEHNDSDYDGFCNICDYFIGAEIKVGDTIEVDTSNGGVYIKFVAPETTKYVLRTQGSGERVLVIYNEERDSGYEYYTEDDFKFAHDFVKDEVYFIRFSTADSSDTFSFSLSAYCTEHSGTLQTCKGYVCDNCGGFFGEEGSCAGVIQTCLGYKCEGCGEWYGEKGEHTLEGEQTCLGYYCTTCEGWYGEKADHTPSGDTACGRNYCCECERWYGEPTGEHVDDDSDGLCDDCDFFLGEEIKAGGTFAVERKTFLKFVPTVSGRYILSSSNTDTCDPYVKLYDGNLYYIDDEDDSFEERLDFSFDYEYMAGETYYFSLYDYNGSYEDYTVTLECYEHQGGKADCTNKAKCEACGTEYGETDKEAHDWSKKDGTCANGCGETCSHEKYTNGVCDNCGKECNHSFTSYAETKASTCKIAGKEVAACDNGCGVTDERELPLLDHEPGEQMCKGYWCSRCRGFYGEGNPDIHLDGYSSTGKIKDGQCDGCNKQLAFIKSGETYEINSYAYVVEFAPVVDGRYILTVDGPEGTEIDVREVFDGVNKGINCEVISDLVYVVDCTVGKIYRFEASNYYGYNISSMTLECETHKGTVQTCYGYICDACGEYFGEVPGHDIVIDEAKAPTCTETGLTEGSHCSRCDDMTVAQEEIPALNHKDTLIKVDAKASTCTEAGHEAYEYCTACDYTTYKEIPASHDIIIDEAVAPKCGKTGLTVGQHCSRCDAMTIIQEIVPALAHKDSDGDYQCDYGCGHEFEKPVEPDQPDTPDEPTDDTCDHLCHKDGILGFFWKIVRFFIKLFKTNPVCECGAAHY